MFNHPVLEVLRRLLGAPSPALQVAALVWRDGPAGLEFLLVTSRGSGRWLLPKGWPEKGEPLHHTALREAGEEAGVTGIAATEPIGSFRYEKKLGENMTRRCEALVYPVQFSAILEDWPERDVRKRAWASPGKAASMVNDAGLSRILLDVGSGLSKKAA